MRTPPPNVVAPPGARGRPIRFLLIVLCLWIAVRGWMLWPTHGDHAHLGHRIAAHDPVARTAPRNPTATRAMPVILPPRPPAGPAPPPSILQLRPMAFAPPVADSPFTDPTLFAPPDVNWPSFAEPPDVPSPLIASPLPDHAPARAISQGEPQGVSTGATPPPRWRGSAWLFTRDDRPVGGAVLGGGQYGVRVTRRIDRRDRLAMFARASAPLRTPQWGAEAAFGAQWQPAGPALRLTAEHRVTRQGGRLHHSPALGLITGIDPRPLPLSFNLEAYGQAGGVWRGRVDPYADGAARITRDIALHPKLTLKLGMGAWGAVQRDAARIDIGPTVVTHVPVAGHPLRLSVDWRARVGGDAAPGSGAALTLGTDF